MSSRALSPVEFDSVGERLLKEKEVSAKIGFGHKWIWQAVLDGRFPKPKYVGRTTRWTMSVVDHWISEL